MSTKKEWTPQDIRDRVTDILRAAGRSLTHNDIHTKMTTCPKQRIKTQIDYLIFKDKIIKRGDRIAVSYSLANTAAMSNSIKELWPASTSANSLEAEHCKGNEVWA